MYCKIVSQYLFPLPTQFSGVVLELILTEEMPVLQLTQNLLSFLPDLCLRWATGSPGTNILY